MELLWYCFLGFINCFVFLVFVFVWFFILCGSLFFYWEGFFYCWVLIGIKCDFLFKLSCCYWGCVLVGGKGIKGWMNVLIIWMIRFWMNYMFLDEWWVFWMNNYVFKVLVSWWMIIYFVCGFGVYLLYF